LVRGYRLLRMPLAVGLPVSRGLLVKRHEAREPAEREPASRTLFVTHIDNFASEAQLAKCFAAGFGAVEKVELKSVVKKAPKAEQRADGVKLHVNFARVVFKEASSVDRAMDAATGRISGTAVLPSPPAELKESMKLGGVAQYRDAGELRREVDEWMASYDQSEEDRKRAAKAEAVDDDGFTKVVSGITRSADGDGNVVAIRAARRPDPKTGAFSEPIKGFQSQNLILDTDYDGHDNNGKKKKTKEMPDFYRFQQREKKRNELLDHRKRKADDEEKVEYMLKKKKFKLNQDADAKRGL